MSETSPFESVVDEAERAATAGDYATAERLLREALIIQEARLGPDHPDIANTLNNLGVVCEHTNNFTEAERSYRRAFAIATVSLAPDHPYVLTSRQNLADFCAARGMPVDLPVPKPAPDAPARPAELEFLSERNRPAKTSPSAPASVVAQSEPAAVPASVEPAFVPARVEPPPAKRPAVPAAPVHSAPPRLAAATPSPEPPPAAGGSRRVVAGVLIVLAIAVVAIVATRLGGTSTESAASSPSPAPPAAAPSTKETAAPAASIAPPVPPAAERSKAATASPAGSGAAASAAGLEIVDARLCRTLSTASGEWTCTPPGDPVSPGPISFYTRLKSKADTTVQVRWYQGSTLRQSGALQVVANPGAGYRTFSRRTIERGGTGEWRVELRTRDGRVLHEERFVVR